MVSELILKELHKNIEEMSWATKVLTSSSLSTPLAQEHGFVACCSFSCASPRCLLHVVQVIMTCVFLSLSVPQGQTTLPPLPLLTTPSAPQVPTPFCLFLIA